MTLHLRRCTVSTITDPGLTDSLTHSLTHALTDRLTDWLTYRLTDWLTDWLTYKIRHCVFQQRVLERDWKKLLSFLSSRQMLMDNWKSNTRCHLIKSPKNIYAEGYRRYKICNLCGIPVRLLSVLRKVNLSLAWILEYFVYPRLYGS